MALTRTTLASAFAIGDAQIVVASATGFAAGRIVRIDDEFFVVQSNYSSGVTIPVRAGQLATQSTAHVASAGVVVGTAADDWDSPGSNVRSNSPLSGRARRTVSITTTPSTLTLPTAGSDTTVILNGTGAIALTVPVPTTDMDGDTIMFTNNGAVAHTLTFTGGLGGVGATADVVTFKADQKQAVLVVACNATWNLVGVVGGAATVAGAGLA